MWKKTHKTTTTILIASCLAVFGLSTALAQLQVNPDAGETNGNQDEIVEKLRDLQAKNQAIQTNLETIAQQAVQENQDLAQMEKDLMDFYQAKLEEHGYPGQDKLAELRQMQTQLQNGEEMSQEERQKLTQKFQQEVTALQEAQQHARQDPELQQKYAAFEEAKLEAMADIDDDVLNMQREQNRIMGQIQALQQQLQGAQR